jgi:phage/plasmid-associated DNA primase
MQDESAISIPIIEITQGLHKTNTIYENVPLNEVEDYLEKNNKSFERTTQICRVYIDIDGKADINMSEEDFILKDNSIEFILLNLDLGSPHSLMKSSKHSTKKDGKRIHIFSYRITLLNKYGSKTAIKYYVENTINPIIKEALKDDIEYITDKKTSTMKKTQVDSTYVDYDESVYGNGRKMRMWKSTKDDDYRPNKLCGESKVIDTLITYIPEGCEKLPEPPEAKIPEPKNTKTPKAKKPEPRILDNITIQTDPCNNDDASITTTINEDKQILIEVINNLSDYRWDIYDDWINIGIVCFNENISFEVWDTNSKKSLKYKKGECHKHWNRFYNGDLKQGTIWDMLKQDNPAKYNELYLKRTDFEKLIKNCEGHSDVAEYFFSLKPNNYLYCSESGWHFVLPSNIWSNSGKNYPVCMLNDIHGTLKTELISFKTAIDIKEKKVVNDESLSDTTRKDKLEKLEEKRKKIYIFGKLISNKSFCEGIIAFLRGLYGGKTLRLCAEKGVQNNMYNIFDENRYLFAFTDYVYDLKLGYARPIKATDYITITCGYKYPTHKSETRNTIRNVLYSIWENEDVLEYMLDILCTTICGVRNIEEWYIWTGVGGNGKGMLINLIENTLGGYYGSFSSEIFTAKNQNPSAPKPEVVNSRGKRFIDTAEPEDNDTILEGFTKLISGGDNITAAGKHKDPITFKPQFMVCLQCNNVPNLNSLTQGSVRRIRVIPFPFLFRDNPIASNERKGDANVKNILCKSPEWRDEFILMLIDQWNKKYIDSSDLEYRKIKGITTIPMPPMVDKRTKDYIYENNPVGFWFKENYEYTEENDEKGVPYYIRTTHVLEAYREYTTNQRYSAKALNKAMDFNQIYSITKTAAPDKGLSVYMKYKKKEKDFEGENKIIM